MTGSILGPGTFDDYGMKKAKKIIVFVWGFRSRGSVASQFVVNESHEISGAFNVLLPADSAAVDEISHENTASSPVRQKDLGSDVLQLKFKSRQSVNKFGVLRV
jgi:hypothetical protein